MPTTTTADPTTAPAATTPTILATASTTPRVARAGAGPGPARWTIVAALRRRVRAAAAAVLLGFGGAAGVAAQVPAPENVVHLSASAQVEVPMDLLQIVFSARGEGPEAAALQAQLAQALDAALAEARRAARAGELEVRTGNFSIAPRYNPRGGTSGWAGSAELIVEGRDAAGVAAAAALAGRIRTMSVASAGWALSRAAREKAEEAVTADAIAQFRAKADRTARLFGHTGWLLREATVGGDGPPPGLPRMAMARAASAEMDAPLPVEGGQATVAVSVSGSVQLTR